VPGLLPAGFPETPLGQGVRFWLFTAPHCLLSGLRGVGLAIPDASSKPPGQVLEFVLEALRIAEAETIDSSEKGR
jgi:hypothetical protein